MSIIHVNQIKHHVLKLFDALIDRSDVCNAPSEQQEDFVLTRALPYHSPAF